MHVGNYSGSHSGRTVDIAVRFDKVRDSNEWRVPQKHALFPSGAAPAAPRHFFPAGFDGPKGAPECGPHSHLGGAARRAAPRRRLLVLVQFSMLHMETSARNRLATRCRPRPRGEPMGQGGSPAASSGSLKRPQRAAGVVSPQHFSRCREVPQMAPWTRAGGTPPQHPCHGPQGSPR
eukprot:gene15635-biopygen12744